MLWCHQVTLQVEPWEIFWKILVEIDWNRERETVHKSISDCIYSSFHLSFSKHFSNISCRSSKCTWLTSIVSLHLLGKGKERNAGSRSELPFVCDLARMKCGDLNLEFSMSFPMLKIYEANYFL